MDTVTAANKGEKYKTYLSNTRVEILADEPENLGGNSLGFSPSDFICASLSSCTTITLKMYIDRKQWVFPEIKTVVQYPNTPKGEQPSLNRSITIKGTPTPEQLERMLQIANLCPMHKVLSPAFRITTEIVPSE
jgi:putative redox protein